MYKLSGVTKTYRKGGHAVNALQGVDLEIADGQWLSVQGPTGHGKTTLLQLLGALDRPTAGKVQMDGQDIGRQREKQLTRLRGRAIGFIFQTFNLIPTLCAAENVETGLVPLGIPPAARQARVTEALQAVGLSDRAAHLPAELSGGQQQRVAIARALARQPKVLLADEPTGNLDEQTRDEIMALLERLWRSQELTMVIVTHDSTVASRAQRNVILRNGQVADPPGSLQVPGTSSQPASG